MVGQHLKIVWLGAKVKMNHKHHLYYRFNPFGARSGFEERKSDQVVGDTFCVLADDVKGSQTSIRAERRAVNPFFPQAAVPKNPTQRVNHTYDRVRGNTDITLDGTICLCYDGTLQRRLADLYRTPDRRGATRMLEDVLQGFATSVEGGCRD